MNPLIQLKKTTPVFLIAVVLVCFGLLPQAQAVSPTPDGFYPNDNTAEGGNTALFSLTTGAFNTALGVNAMFLNTTGSNNTAVGNSALKRNLDGANNTAIGFEALLNNTFGNDNTATGDGALFSNTTGSFNTATGDGALNSNTTGANNTANGLGALESNMTGGSNTANGLGALRRNTFGSSNTASGFGALFSNTDGSNNTAIGTEALFFSETGQFNIALGFGAGSGVTTASNVICIGATGANVPHRCYIGEVFGVTVSEATGTRVFIDANGQLGTITSSARFKDEIRPMDKASEAILALKPVTFHYKEQIDPKKTAQFGLVAEEVEKVNPDLITRDRDGKPYTVRYDAVNAMLLNEFLKAHRRIEEQQKQIEALTAGLQKVSEQLETSRPAPQTVANNQ